MATPCRRRIGQASRRVSAAALPTEDAGLVQRRAFSTSMRTFRRGGTRRSPHGHFVPSRWLPLLQLLSRGETLRSATSKTYARKHFDFVALNMWGDREVVPVNGETYSEKELAAALKVQYTPTLMFFDERGQVALRVDGYARPAASNTRSSTWRRSASQKLPTMSTWPRSRLKGKTNTPLNAQPFFMPSRRHDNA